MSHTPYIPPDYPLFWSPGFLVLTVGYLGWFALPFHRDKPVSVV